MNMPATLVVQSLDDIGIEADARGGAGMAWFALGLCAVTIGVATGARDYAVAFARERTPNLSPSRLR